MLTTYIKIKKTLKYKDHKRDGAVTHQRKQTLSEKIQIKENPERHHDDKNVNILQIWQLLMYMYFTAETQHGIKLMTEQKKTRFFK